VNDPWIATWKVIPLGPVHLDSLMPLRLEALRDHPETFGVDLSEETPEEMKRLIGRHPSVTLGGFSGETLVGTAGLDVGRRVKQRHKGHIYGVYVTPRFRRSGLSHALMVGLIEHARRVGLLRLTLSVTVGNDVARRLYEGFGFRSYGIEPGSLSVAGRLYDEELMTLALR
jgi:ribosomal protein S18 acetylase RimI-like enzyme